MLLHADWGVAKLRDISATSSCERARSETVRSERVSAVVML